MGAQYSSPTPHFYIRKNITNMATPPMMLKAIMPTLMRPYIGSSKRVVAYPIAHHLQPPQSIHTTCRNERVDINGSFIAGSIHRTTKSLLEGFAIVPSLPNGLAALYMSIFCPIRPTAITSTTLYHQHLTILMCRTRSRCRVLFI